MLDEKENGSNIHPIIRALDLAWEFSLFSKFIFYFLFIDLACFQVIGYGLWSVKIQDLGNLSIGNIGGVFIFWVLMLAILDFIRVTIRLCLPYRGDFKRKHGRVSPSELFTEAVKTDSSVFYNIHLKARSAQENRIKLRRRLEITCIGVLLLIILEWVKVIQSEGGGLFVEWVAHILKSFSQDPISQGWVAFIMCFLSFLSVVVVYAGRLDFTADYVDCPSLYYKLKSK
ncbi:hypothetical protein [Ewingella allii]|uniref:hypothetical protein n=1 Tax=Ewingella allii TaxID=3092550 RepID=UPI00378CE892